MKPHTLRRTTDTNYDDCSLTSLVRYETAWCLPGPITIIFQNGRKYEIKDPQSKLVGDHRKLTVLTKGQEPVVLARNLVHSVTHQGNVQIVAKLKK